MSQDPTLPDGCTNKALDKHMGGPDLGTKECPDCEGSGSSDASGDDALELLASIRDILKQGRAPEQSIIPLINKILDCPTCQGEGVVDRTEEDAANDRAAHLEAQADAREDR